MTAVDMPFLTPSTLDRLRTAARTGAPGAGASTGDGAILVGPDGRTQLAMLLSTSRLDEVRPDYESQHDMALRHLLEPLDLQRVTAIGDEHRDIDTWSDLRTDRPADPPTDPPTDAPPDDLQ